MKKEYMKPEAEKLTFDFSENVTASYRKTAVSTENWVCDSQYDFGDAPQTCGSQHQTSGVSWVCNNNP